MPCYRPLTGFWDGAGGEVAFSPSVASKRRLELPCGRCIGCRLERSRQWAVRLLHEKQMHDFACFVTLTYDDAHLPADRSLSVRDFQLFMKRLRFALSPTKVRFYACGEYGDTTWRPHYHVLLFGVHFADAVRVQSSGEHQLFRSPTLDKAWGLGFVSFGSVTFQSAQYVAGYCIKKIGGEKAKDHYRRVDPKTGEVFDLRPEFALMSKGIGRSWYEKWGSDVYPSDEVIQNGLVGKPPRYYDLRAKQDRPADFEKVRVKRIANAEKRWDDSSPKRLRVREIVATSKKSLKRTTL